MDSKVLIVDDVETNRLILEDIIENMGCEPVLADSGKMALELVSKAQPQLILTDISMPEMDGYELCRILKSNEQTKQIPIVFISAFDHPEDIVEGLPWRRGLYHKAVCDGSHRSARRRPSASVQRKAGEN